MQNIIRNKPSNLEQNYLWPKKEGGSAISVELFLELPENFKTTNRKKNVQS